MRMTFVIGSLAAGGAQRVLILLAEGLSRRGHGVSIVTLNGKEEDFFEVPEGVPRIAVGIRGFVQTIPGIFKLRRAIRSTRPDIVVSFIDVTNIITLVATSGLKAPVVVSERIDPSRYQIGAIWEMLRRWAYPFAGGIVVQTARARDYFLPRFQSTVRIIPNPVVLPKAESPIPFKLPKPSIVALGRFHPQKGYDILFRAFALIKDRHPDWSLTILGDGAMRNELESLADRLGLGKQLNLPGQVQNPHAILKQADLFVLSSRFEGFPNALCEAMAAGLPVISTDCPSGPREIIRDGIDGVLVENENAAVLSEAMERLMSNKQERGRLSAESVKVARRFDGEQVIQMWEDLFLELV